MKTIKIDGEIFQVEDKVFRLFNQMEDDVRQAQKQEEIHKKALKNSTRMLNQAKYCVSVLAEGKNEDAAIWSLGAKLEVEHNAEVRNGLLGWLQKNWSKICSVSFDCGHLISYDVVRESGELKCKKCYNELTPAAG